MKNLYLYIFIFLIIYLIFNSCKYQESFVDMIPSGIEVKESKFLKKKSRGLYATKNYKKDDTIEICPTLIMNKKQVTKDNVLNDHFFKGKIGNNELVSLGYCSLINHSIEKQNVTWKIGENDEYITIIAIKDINKGEELFSNYGKAYWNSRNKKMKEK
jgi:SET domain-containing protein